MISQDETLFQISRYPLSSKSRFGINHTQWHRLFQEKASTIINGIDCYQERHRPLKMASLVYERENCGAVGSWFEPLTEKPVQCSPQNYFWAPCSASSGQMTFNFTRGHVSPLALLMCNVSPAKPRIDDADKLSLTMMSVNKSSAIISRRDVEKVTCFYESLFVLSE